MAVTPRRRLPSLALSLLAVGAAAVAAVVAPAVAVTAPVRQGLLPAKALPAARLLGTRNITYDEVCSESGPQPVLRTIPERGGGRCPPPELFGSAVVSVPAADGRSPAALAISVDDDVYVVQYGSFAGVAAGEVAKSVPLRRRLSRLFPEDIILSFGEGLAKVGDVDGDGAADLAIYATIRPVGARGKVARRPESVVFIIMLNADGSVKDADMIRLSATFGCPAGSTCTYAMEAVGDVNGDGYADLLIATNWRSTAVVLLHPKAEGMVRAVVPGRSPWYAGGKFVPDAPSVASLGDVDGDGVPDVAINDPYYKGNKGAVVVLLLAKDGSVKKEVTLTPGSGGLPTSFNTPKNWAGLLAFGGVSPGTEKTVAVGTVGSNRLTFLYLGSNAYVQRYRPAVVPQALQNLDSLALEEGTFASSLTTAGASGRVLHIFSFLF
ncbi:hypothetical protein MMPV_000102 [Pyropia vietnamensis]